MEFVRQVINSDLLDKITLPYSLKNRKVEIIILPFAEEFRKEQAQPTAKLPRLTAKGILKDKVWMSDDFNEPLEELREYME